MPRNTGTGVYEQPAPDVITATTIESTVYNVFVNDVETDLNLPRPVVAGGTGANSALGARDNLDAEVRGVQVTNYDTHVFEAGSFYSDNTATNPPIAGHYFIGFCIMYAESPLSTVIIQAWDMSDGNVPVIRYTRQKVSGVWSAWVTESAAANFATTFVNVTGDTMIGDLEINKALPSLSLKRTDSGAARVLGYRGVNLRWATVHGDGTAETGANAGSDFQIIRFDDAGAALGVALMINRASGSVGMNNINTVSLTTGPIACTTIAATGDVSITKVNPSLSLAKSASGEQCLIEAKTAGNLRWRIVPGNGTAESAGTGSDFQILRFNDAGTFISPPAVEINRSTGAMTVGGTVTATSHEALKGAATMPVTGGGVRVGFAAGNVGVVTRGAVDAIWHCAFENTSGTVVGNITTSAAATAYNTSSDERLKEDLKSFDAGNIVDDTNVYDFAWKATGERAFGVIAQQAVNVYPTAVHHEKDRDAWFVDYSKYTPVILQELKALRARVATLEGKPA